jgi:DNA (cytosine-5)-methyltransferase 1
MVREGTLASALPAVPSEPTVVSLDGVDVPDVIIKGHPAQITQEFGWGRLATPFARAGVMWNRSVWTRDVEANYDGPHQVLGDVVQSDDAVPPEFFIAGDRIDTWRYLKGAKRENRMTNEGFVYAYTEGAIAFPDPLDRPSRTILTGEGGSTPSRFKHIVEASDGRLRRLTPVELERLNGFPDDWTNTGMSDGRRAFMMGNSLVVGLVERVGAEVAQAALRALPEITAARA